MSVALQQSTDAGVSGWLDAGPPLPEDEDFGFRMANLYPRNTGLPMTVWIGPNTGVRHDVRVKVCMIPGDVMHADQLATVAVRPEPRLLHGRLSREDLEQVSRWIALNRDVIVGYWDGDLGTPEMALALKKV